MMTRLQNLPRTSAVAAMIVGATTALASAQAAQAPAPPGDALLNEVRAMRAELNQVMKVSVRTQLLVARLQLEEQRIESIARQLADSREKLSAAEPTRALFAAQMKMFEGATKNKAGSEDDPVLGPLMKMFSESEKRTQELKGQTASLETLLASELSHWNEFNSRLDEVERELLQAVR